MQAFVAVAEEGSFTAAARRLAVAQPALSRQVRALEEALGVTLLFRARRRVNSVELTVAGRVYLGEARRTLAQAARATRAARRAEAGNGQGEGTGRLVLGHLGAPNLGLLVGAARSWQGQHPGAELVLRFQRTVQMVDALGTGQLDAALLHLSAPVRAGALAWAPVAAVPLVAILPAGHPLADPGLRDRPLALGELAGEPLVFCPRESRETFYDFVWARCLRAGFRPRVVAESADMPSIPHLVATGAGVSLVPALVAETPVAGVVYRSLRAPVPLLRKVLAWRGEGDASPLLGSFVAAVRDARARGVSERGVPPA